MSRGASLLQTRPDVRERLERLVFIRVADGNHLCRSHARQLADERPAQLKCGGVCEHEEPVVLSCGHGIRDVLTKIPAYDDCAVVHSPFHLLVGVQSYTLYIYKIQNPKFKIQKVMKMEKKR